MAQRSGIEWTEVTWNPVTGCTRVSSGCDNCYAATLSNRLLRKIYCSRPPEVDNPLTRKDPFAVRLWPERIQQPLRWREPRIVFVNSMSDLFHVDIPEDFTRQLFRVMLQSTWHTFQILTKRPARAARFWKRNGDLFERRPLPPHIWIGTSVEDQRVHYRIGQLRQVPAAVRFVSCEPLLGPLHLDLQGIHWVIVGGESGPARRPMEPEWALAIRDQCLAARVPFFFKQWGGRTPKAGGRRLEGRLWSQMPAIVVGRESRPW